MNIDAFIRPSSTDENAACPARPTIQTAVVELIGEPESAPEANLGTAAHAWGEAGIRLLVCDEDFQLLDAIQPIDDALAELREAHAKEDPARRLDSWTWNVVEQYVRFVYSLIVKHGITPENVLVEERLDMADLGFVNKGTSDCMLIVPYETVIVVDLKAGFVDQGDAADHGQLAAYGCAAALRFKAKRCEVWIAQPRAEKPHRFTGATFDMHALREAATWISSVNAACRAPNPELIAGFRQCSNCRALRLCPAAKEFFMHAREALDLIGPPTTPEEWGALADAAKLADKFGEQGKDMVKEHLVAGGTATGWKLGAGRAIRTIANVPAALQKLSDAGHGAAAAEALSMSYSKLPDEAVAIISDQITEKLSAPALVADKRSAKGAA